MNQVKRKTEFLGFPEAPNGLDRFCQRNERGARSECFPQPFKERLDEGREMRRGKENAFGDRDLFFIENEEGRGWPRARVI